MKKALILMDVKGIALDRDTELPIVLLQTTDKRSIVPISIGPFEASAIIIEIEGVHPPRPLTHDLLSHFFNKHNFFIIRLEIYDEIDESYLAKIYYKKGLRTYKIEVRPSDGIAMAIRAEAPIYTYPHVLNKNTDKQWFMKNTQESNPEIIFLNNTTSTHVM